MSRVIVGRLPDSQKRRQQLSGMGGRAEQGSCKDDEEEGVPRQGVVADLSGKVGSARSWRCLEIAWRHVFVFLLNVSLRNNFSTHRKINLDRSPTNSIKNIIVITCLLSHNRQPQDAPYASAAWSLAVAYNVGSWRGGLRQRYYFGRLTSFLAYRRRRKAALRARVGVRMAKRWATRRKSCRFACFTMLVTCVTDTGSGVDVLVLLVGM